MIQGTSSGSGKTTLVIALCRIFRNLGYAVAPFKSQNMSNFVYKYDDDYEISMAQALQAIASKTKIIPDINPILLKPLGNYQSAVFVRGKFYKIMNTCEYYNKFINIAFNIAIESLDNLKQKHDLIIIEGAGSPAEINMTKYDITNMKIAERSRTPVILITDIDRGGSFANVVGTMKLLNMKHRSLIKGFIFNKFRGDIKILYPGFEKLLKYTTKPTFGVIPKINIKLPQEDSLDRPPKNHILDIQNLKSINAEIENICSVIENNIKIKKIEEFL